MDEFTGKAQAYEMARPGYAAAALDFIAGLLPPGAAVADIGAGTGKFTRPLAQWGFEVYAVEPNADMRGYLTGVPGVHVLNGAAEATGLPEHCVDAVTCAQAFHWFDPEGFQAECRRILKPGGRVFVVYNRPEPGDVRHQSPELAWHSSSDRQSVLETRIAALRGFFGPDMREEHFANLVEYTREGYISFMLSHSHSPRPGDETYERFLASVNAVFDRCSVDGKLTLPLQTFVYTN